MKLKSFLVACFVLFTAGPILGQSATDSLSGTLKGYMGPGPTPQYAVALSLKLTDASAVSGTLAGLPKPGDIKKDGGQPAAPQAVANVTTELKRSFDEVNGWVMKAADMVPAEKYNYRPVETVRTFGQIVAHVTDAYNYFCSRGAGKNVEWSDANEKGSTDKVSLMPKLKQAIEACNAAYASGNQIGPLIDNVGHTSLH